MNLELGDHAKQVPWLTILGKSLNSEPQFPHLTSKKTMPPASPANPKFTK